MSAILCAGSIIPSMRDTVSFFGIFGAAAVSFYAVTKHMSQNQTSYSNSGPKVQARYWPQEGAGPKISLKKGDIILERQQVDIFPYCKTCKDVALVPIDRKEANRNIQQFRVIRISVFEVIRLKSAKEAADFADNISKSVMFDKINIKKKDKREQLPIRPAGSPMKATGTKALSSHQEGEKRDAKVVQTTDTTLVQKQTAHNPTLANIRSDSILSTSSDISGASDKTINETDSDDIVAKKTVTFHEELVTGVKVTTPDDTTEQPVKEDTKDETVEAPKDELDESTKDEKVEDTQEDEKVEEPEEEAAASTKAEAAKPAKNNSNNSNNNKNGKGAQQRGSQNFGFQQQRRRP